MIQRGRADSFGRNALPASAMPTRRGRPTIKNKNQGRRAVLISSRTNRSSLNLRRRSAFSWSGLGARRLETLYGKRCRRAALTVSRGIVDRPEAQSVVHEALARSYAHELWNEHRELFSESPDAPPFQSCAMLARRRTCHFRCIPREDCEELCGDRIALLCRGRCSEARFTPDEESRHSRIFVKASRNERLRNFCIASCVAARIFYRAAVCTRSAAATCSWQFRRQRTTYRLHWNRVRKDARRGDAIAQACSASTSMITSRFAPPPASHWSKTNCSNRELKLTEEREIGELVVL